MDSIIALTAFWMGFSSVLLVLALLLVYKLTNFLKSTVRELLDELRKL